MKRGWRIALGVLIVLLVAACDIGGDDSGDEEAGTARPLMPGTRVADQPLTESASTPVETAEIMATTPAVTEVSGTATPVETDAPVIEPTATTRPTELPEATRVEIEATPELRASETPDATATPLPTDSPAPLPSPADAEQALPTRTPLPTLTPSAEIPGQDAIATSVVVATRSEAAGPSMTWTPWPLAHDPTFTMTPPPSFTPWYTLAPATSTPLPSPTGAFVQPPPTFTPVIVPQTPMSPTPIPFMIDAQVHPAAAPGLRLRATPGTAGEIVDTLPVGTSVSIVGRTGDNAWVQIQLSNGVGGWVFTNYLTLTPGMDLNTRPVTGTATDQQVQPVPVDAGGYGAISNVNATARNIFLDGLAKGNSPHVFTKVGDSISASPHFLVPIASGVYNLGDQGYLLTAIRFFSGPNGRGANPFGATSMAARNGWGTTSALNPANSDPNLCRPGETPLQCEYRLVKPSVALIMFGTNDSGGLPTSEFRANMRRIVQISIDMGVIPVLSTIPPKDFNPATDGRVPEFNQVIIGVAQEYDIPLWDYGRVMSQAPNWGLASDGVHPSIPPNAMSADFTGSNLNYGFPLRNLTALQVLYTLWQYVLYDGDEIAPAPAPQPLPATVDPGAPVVSDCMGAPPPRLTVGGLGRVTPGLANNVRDIPSTGGQKIGSIPGAAVFSVLDGPVCADGYLWWKVSYEGLVGWTANGSSSEYWVEPN